MAQFKAYSPTVEVNGETVLSVVDGMGLFKKKAIEILSQCGIDNPQPGQWYSQQAWLDAFKIIAESVGDSTLFTIGQKIPENAQFPPEIDSLGKALGAIDMAYHMNHKGGEIGHYTLERSGERSAKVICKNPYPCEFDRGIISAFVKRFKPKGFDHYGLVSHEHTAECRKKGGESCTYSITW